MRYLLLILVLAGCGSSSDDNPMQEKTYLVAGQSNALVCNWAVFEEWTGGKVVNIALGGRSIDSLISMFNPKSIKGIDFDAVIFIHGESDAIEETYPPYYVERVEYYRELLGVSDKPFYVTSVGYTIGSYPDELFDPIREIQRETWNIVYDGAWQFRERGMLIDEIHFGREACEEIFQGVIHVQ